MKHLLHLALAGVTCCQTPGANGEADQMTVWLDGGKEFRSYLSAVMRAQPVTLDRFGIFNMQLYHGAMRFHVSDFTVNGQKIDLSKDRLDQALILFGQEPALGLQPS